MSELNYEDAKRELKSYPKLVKKSLQLLERAKELQEKIRSADGQKITGLPGCQGKVNDLSDYIVALEIIEKKREQAIKKMAIIENKIALLEDDELSEVLRLRYKNELNWSEVANQFDRSEIWAKKKNKPAIKAYAELEV